MFVKLAFDKLADILPVTPSCYYFLSEALNLFQTRSWVKSRVIASGSKNGSATPSRLPTPSRPSSFSRIRSTTTTAAARRTRTRRGKRAAQVRIWKLCLVLSSLSSFFSKHELTISNSYPGSVVGENDRAMDSTCLSSLGRVASRIVLSQCPRSQGK